MALVPATLQAGILQVLTGTLANPAATPATIAAAWAQAYQAYAATAQTIVGMPLVLSNLTALQGGLATVFATLHPDAASAASDLAARFPLFWAGAIFGATGPVTFPGAPAPLAASLAAAFAANLVNPAATPALVAGQIATALDLFTRTVLAGDTVIPIPTGTPPAPIL